MSVHSHLTCSHIGTFTFFKSIHRTFTLSYCCSVEFTFLTVSVSLTAGPPAVNISYCADIKCLARSSKPWVLLSLCHFLPALLSLERNRLCHFKPVWEWCLNSPFLLRLFILMWLPRGCNQTARPWRSDRRPLPFTDFLWKWITSHVTLTNLALTTHYNIY